MQTRINREDENKYITNSTGLFKRKHPINVFIPTNKKNNERAEIAKYLIRVKTVIAGILVCSSAETFLILYKQQG